MTGTGADEFSNFLNNMGAGTFILIIIFTLSLASAITAVIMKIFSKHKKKVENETIKTLAEVNQCKTINELVNTMNTVVDKLSAMDQLHDNVIPKVNQLDTKVTKMDDLAEILIEANKSSIKAYIVSEYHKWMRKKYIDIYSLSLLEEQYEEYTKLHGNTFVKDMMIQIRQLPTRAYIQDSNGKDPIKYFDKEHE